MICSADSVTALWDDYKEVLNPLKTIKIDTKTSSHAKNENHWLIK